MPSRASDSARPAVCIVRHNYYPDSHVRRDAEALAQEGYDVTVIALRRPGQPRREALNGVTVRRLPVTHRRGSPPRYLWEYLAFAALAFLTVSALHLRRRFRVVEVDNMPDILVFSALVPKLTGTPVILYIFDNMPELLAHLWRTSKRHPLVRLLASLERISAAFADHVVVTQEIAGRAVVGRGVAPDKVSVVLNGPDEAVFRSELRGERAQRTDRFQIVTHGSILERFGIQTLIEALPRIRETVPGVEVHVYGEGEYLPVLEKRARDFGVDDLVHFHGLVPFEQMARYLLRADVGYVGMLCDLMLSNKLMEYVALGIPAVVARWPTYEHYFPADTVTYFKPGDADDLARALVAIYRDPAGARARADRALARYQRYRWPVQREVYLGIYRELRAKGEQVGDRRYERPPQLLP